MYINMFLYNPFGYFSFCHKRYQITVKRISTRNKTPVPYYPQGLMQLIKIGIKINEARIFHFLKTKIDFIIVADITP